MLKFLLAIGLIAQRYVQVSASEVCYGDLGCFRNDGPFFNLIFRPVSFLPWDPTSINTTFILYTRKNIHTGEYFKSRDIDTIKNSDYNSAREKTFFLTHGFGDSVNSPWIRNIKEALLNVSDVNVILVDWSHGSQTLYTQATANARVVGREIGNLLNTLKESFSLDLDNAHIVGHSLGAHVGGYAGKWLNDTKLGRITGLDPAGPFFQYMPDVVKLVMSDAKFVDAIHTDGSKISYTSFGSFEPNGHADFYPDGGFSLERCSSGEIYNESILSKLYNELKDKIMCPHFKAGDIYFQSIVGPCPFTAYSCVDFKSYEEGKCSTCQRPGYDCIQAGYNIDKYNHAGLNNTKFYFTTTDIRPALCIYHWAIDIRVSATKNFKGGTEFQLSVKGREGPSVNASLKNSSETLNGTQRYLLNFNQDPVEIDYVVLSWSRHSSVVLSFISLFSRGNTPPLMFIDGITFTPIDRIGISGRAAKATTFCKETNSSGIPENEQVVFTSNRGCL